LAVHGEGLITAVQASLCEPVRSPRAGPVSSLARGDLLDPQPSGLQRIRASRPRTCPESNQIPSAHSGVERAAQAPPIEPACFAQRPRGRQRTEHAVSRTRFLCERLAIL
jgi:hypothetical protein